MLDPMPGTRIGIGYRSEIEYVLDGRFGDNINVPIAGHFGSRFNAEAELTTPDIVTISITQDISPSMRVMGTFEWTNWSDFDQLDIVSQQTGVLTVLGLAAQHFALRAVHHKLAQIFASLPTNWDDAWYAALGVEADIGGGMTLRTGVAYEESPIQKATQRITAAPDNDRIWLSGGLSWALSPSMSVDASYTHIIVEDGKIERDLISNSAVTLFAEAETSVDIISVGMNMKLGHDEEPFK